MFASVLYKTYNYCLRLKAIVSVYIRYNTTESLLFFLQTYNGSSILLDTQLRLFHDRVGFIGWTADCIWKMNLLEMEINKTKTMLKNILDHETCKTIDNTLT